MAHHRQKLLELITQQGQVETVFAAWTTTPLGAWGNRLESSAGINDNWVQFVELRLFDGPPGRETLRERMVLLAKGSRCPRAKLKNGFFNQLLLLEGVAVRDYLSAQVGKMTTVDMELDYYSLGEPAGMVLSLAGDREQFLFRWERHTAHSLTRYAGPGVPLQEGTTLVAAKPADEAFADGAADESSRVILKRRFPDWRSAFRMLLSQSSWSGGQAFDPGEAAHEDVLAWQWNTGEQERDSRIALQVTRRALFGWWNATTAEILYTALLMAKDGRFASFVPRLPMPSKGGDFELQLRFRCTPEDPTTAEAGAYEVQYKDWLSLNGSDAPKDGFDMGHHENLECPGFVDHDGSPLVLRADVRMFKSPDAFGDLRLLSLSVPGKQTVRLGALDLSFDGTVANAGMQTSVVRLWAQSGGVCLKWAFDASETLINEGPSVGFVILTNTLPVTISAVGGQDREDLEQPLFDPRKDMAGHIVTEVDMGRIPVRELPLVIPLADQGTVDAWISTIETSVDVSTTMPLPQPHRTQIKLFSSDDADAITAALVIDPQPLQVLLAMLRTRPDTNDPSKEIAVWDSGAAGGPSWQVQRPFYEYRFPPQGLGEGMEKWIQTLAAPNQIGSAGTVPETGNDIAPGGLADMRFTPNASVQFVSTYRDENYGEPGTNTRRLLANVGERDPGVKVDGMTLELLYGMEAKVTYPHLRLADLVTRLGGVPTSVPSTLTSDESRKRWAAAFLAYHSRLALLELHDTHDFRDELKQREGLMLTEDVSFAPREILESKDTPDPDYGMLLPTPRLRYPISEARQAVTPVGVMESKKRYHCDDGLPGGFQWGFESVAIYEAFWRHRKSSSGELSQLGLSAMGANGKLKARFNNDLLTIEGRLGLGRTHYYSVERLGRIAVYWNKAKHVIVYERSTAPTAQQFGYQDDHLGRPVLRKVREYIEILEFEKLVPDKDSDPADCGPVRGNVFHDRTILVHGSWGGDVYDPAGVKPIGWQIPLWREAKVDTRIYPKPQVSLRFPSDASQSDETYLAPMGNPQDLWFFTDTRDEATADVMSWPPVLNVDYCDAAIPPAFLEDQEHASDNASLEGDLADPPAVPLGLERFTFLVDRTEQKANLAAGRTESGQVSAIVCNITMMRAASVATTNTASQALGHAAQLVTQMDQQWEKVANWVQTDLDPNNFPALRAKVVDSLSKARAMASDLDTAIGTLSPPTIPGTPTCSYPLIYWTVEQPLKRLIEDRKAFTADRLRTTVFEPWRRDLESFATISTDVVAEKKRIVAVLRSSVERFRDGWQQVEITVAPFLTMPSRLLDEAATIASTRLHEWFGAWEDQIKQLSRDTATTTVILENRLGDFRAGMQTALADPNGIFMREIGSKLEPLLTNVTIEDPANPGPPPAQISIWALFVRERDALITSVSSLINDWINELQTSTDPDIVLIIGEHVRETLEQIEYDEIDAETGLLPRLYTSLRGQLDQVVNEFDGAIKRADTVITELAIQSKARITDKLEATTDVSLLVQAAIDLANSEIAKFESNFKTNVLDSLWRYVDAAAVTLITKLCPLGPHFPFDFNEAKQRILDLLAAAGKWVQPLEDLFNACKHDAAELARRIRALGNDLDREVHRLTGQVQEGIAKAQRATGSLDALAQAGNDKLRAFRAFCESPDIFPVKFNRRHIVLIITEGRKALDMTPIVARYQEAADALGALGLRLPSRQVLDRLLPASLENFDASTIFSDLGGIRFDKFIPGLRMPQIADDHIKVTHGFDKETLRAWVRAEADVDMPSPATLFSIGPVAVNLRSANFSAYCHTQADADRNLTKEATGAVRGAWEVSIGGTEIVTFDDTALRFDNGTLRFDLQPSKIRLNALLKMISDLFPNMGGDGKEGDDGTGISVGLTTIDFQGIKLPSGVRVKLDLPLPNLAAGTFSITGLHLGAFFRMRAINEQLQFAFQLAAGFNLGRKESPFTITIFILGGGGWVEVDAEYEPGENALSTNVSIGITASAVLSVNFAVASGTVGIYLGVFAEFHARSGSPSAMAIGIMVLVRGDVDVMGIVSVYLSLLLEAVYERDGEGSRLYGRGTIVLRIKICWCFTLSVEKSVTRVLAESSAGATTNRSLADATSPVAPPKDFGKYSAASKRKSSLLV